MPQRSQDELGQVADATDLPLFIAVNTGCNMSCGYCTEFGESRDTTHGKLPLLDLQRFIALAHRAGFRTFRATGGEPTLRLDLDEILTSTQALSSDVRIALTTNGTRLGQLIPVLKKLRRPRVFVSVDAMDANAVSGTFSIQKLLTPRLDETIQRVREVADVRINFVLTAGTRQQVWPLIEYCASRGVDLKIFELLYRDYFYAGERKQLEVFKTEFVPVGSLVDELRTELGTPVPYAGTGGRGIPMFAFAYENIKVIYFDSFAGSHYHETCLSCTRYPCQEGMYAVVLNATGVIHPAGCTNTRFHTSLIGLDDWEAIEAFARLRDAVNESDLSRAIPQFILDWSGDDSVPIELTRK